MTNPEQRTPISADKEFGDDWHVLDGTAAAWFDAPSLSTGAAMVGRIAELTAGTRLPDIDLRPEGLRIRVADAGSAGAGITEKMSAVARDLGLVPDPTALQELHLAVDTADRRSVMDFWRAATSYEPDPADDLRDPARRDPTIRFHEREGVPPLRSRFHVDVVRPPEAVEAVRVAVGQQPYGAYGLTLADSDGNEADLVPGDPLGEGSETADWRVVFAAMTHYPTPSVGHVTGLVTAIADLADRAGVALLIDIRPDGVTIDSGKDQWEDATQPTGSHLIDLAARIQFTAHDLGLTADPNRARFVQFGLDVVDIPAARDFWTAFLGYRQDQRDGVTDIYDPRRLNPEIIFQDLDASDERRRQRDRIRLELIVPPDRARARIDAAVALGARVADDDGRHGCRLVDPEGNEVNLRWA